MRTVRLGLIAAAVGAAVLAPAARADTITENFTITISPAATISTGNNVFAGTSVAQFNPANGTLTSMSMSLTGSASWTSTSAPSEGRLHRTASQDTLLSVPAGFD
jgi:Na+-transporting NADH:ubiquinone oxidoreductase subunit NqrB